mmetsp:Transcript_1799/g.5458  ORF Transcript_1799/g.5458 Transcript_1799/m.5458 type:complete len:193 (-) Transcript_1799:3234-3812(-)
MGLLTVLRKIKQKEREMRLLILGLDNAGKTTVVRRLNGDDVHTVSPTVGFSITPMCLGEYSLNLWDVGGQKTIRTFWRNYFEQTDGIIWVVDSADRSRLAVCREELASVLKEERLAGATVLILANKQDLASAMLPSEVEQELDLSTVSTAARHWLVIGCSAFCGSDDNQANGLREGIQWLVDDIASRVFMFD